MRWSFAGNISCSVETVSSSFPARYLLSTNVENFVYLYCGPENDFSGHYLCNVRNLPFIPDQGLTLGR